MLCGLPLLIGIFGLHRLYVGKTATGVMLLSISILFPLVFLPDEFRSTRALFLLLDIAVGGVWQIVDLLKILSGRMKDGNGLPVMEWS